MVVIAIAVAVRPAFLNAQKPDTIDVTESASKSPAAPLIDSRVRLPGAVYFGAADVDWTGRDPESASLGLGFEMAGPISDRTQLNVSLIRGPADLLSALTVANLYRLTIRASLTNPTWGVTAGELTTGNRLLSGPSIRADGLKIELRRRIVADLAVARPFYLGSGSGGHVVQGRVGVRTSAGTVALVGSDLSRPLEIFAPAVAVATDPATQVTDTELDTVRQLLSRQSRMRGWGVESDFHFGAMHTLFASAGVMELANQAGQSTRGPAAETHYVLMRRSFSVNAYGRHAPASIPGMYVPGDALSVGAKVPVSHGVSAIAQTYSNVNWLFGQAQPIRSTGLYAALQGAQGTHRFSIQYNDRRVRATANQLDTVSHTLSGTLSVPIGPLRLDARGEAGPTRRGAIRHTVQTYRLTLNADVAAQSLWISAGYDDYGFQPPRARLDAGMSAELRGLKLELGGGRGTGQLLGNDLSASAKIEMPVARAFTLMTRIDYLKWDYTASPYLALLLSEAPVSPWRLSLGLSRPLSVPIPFAHRRQSDARRPDSPSATASERTPD
jgi:hypothetical protein